MSPAYKYKKLENPIIEKIRIYIVLITGTIRGFLKVIFRRLRRTRSTVIVKNYYSIKPGYKISINYNKFIVLLLVVLFLLGIIIYLTINITNIISNEEYLSKLNEINNLYTKINKLKLELNSINNRINELNTEYEYLLLRKYELENEIELNEIELEYIKNIINKDYWISHLITFFLGVVASLLATHIYNKFINIYRRIKK